MTFFKAYGKRQALLVIKCWENSFGWTKNFISFHMSILKNVFFKTKRIQVYISKKSHSVATGNLVLFCCLLFMQHQLHSVSLLCALFKQRAKETSFQEKAQRAVFMSIPGAGEAGKHGSGRQYN